MIELMIDIDVEKFLVCRGVLESTEFQIEKFD